MGVPAIETRYRGYRFRSRLEARWAVFFDALKIRWNYEPEGYELPGGLRYLPDFYLPEFDFFAEIKPETASDVDFEKAIELSKATRKHAMLLSGIPSIAPFPIYDPILDLGVTDCIITNCGVGFHSDIYWNSGGGLPARQIEEMCNGITAAVEAARSARFEHGESGAA